MIGPRQLKALKTLHSNECRGHAPLTRTELGARMGITKVSAHLLINKLEAAGMVTRVTSGHRNVFMTDAGRLLCQPT